MFQNISKQDEEVFDEDVELNKENRVKGILKENLSIQNCIIYILAFMVSLVGGQDSMFTSIAPFGFAIIAASIGARIPALLVCIVTLIGTTIKFGGNGLLFYILTLLIFLAFVLIKRPKEEEERNEKIKLGIQVSLAVFIVQTVKMLFNGFLVYDLAYNIMLSLVTYILYKVFVNALVVFSEAGIKKVFSIEEVMGSALLLAIAVNCLGNLSIFGYSIRNILSILIVLVMGWKNGMLVGATTGITIGTVLGILNGQDPTMLAAYAISGLVAGLLNKLGKIGVIVGFIIGNIILSYVANGNTIEVIKFQEILIAALGLLAVPKSYKLDISTIENDEKLLPETTTRTLEENKDTIHKLSKMSDTISQMAKEYEDAAASIVTDEELEQQERANREIFEEELFANLEGKEDNLLYDDLASNNEGILDEIFEIMLKKDVITRKEIVQIFANHNNYIMGFSTDSKEDEYVAQNDIDEVLRAINSSYRISKINFVWKKKLDEKKKIEDLSLGNLKKLGIVLAFMHNPKLVILDEPTSGLDPIMQNNFFDILKEEKEKGTTILYSTHILSEVSKICDKVGIVKDGHLIHETTIEDLQKNNFNFITIISSDIDKIKKELDLPIILENKDIIKFKNDLEINLILNKLVNYKIDKLLIEDPTLEDLFMHYYN